jgi:hypothetical protein
MDLCNTGPVVSWDFNEMKLKWAFFIVLTAFLAAPINSILIAADTIEIELVRDKTVLNERDKEVIDAFLAQAIGNFLTTKDFTSIAKLRVIILNNQKSKQPNQNQYSNQFSESAHKYISEGFKQAQILRPPERQTRVIMNFLILIDSLQDLNLLDLAMQKLHDENMAVRYWAVHAVTNVNILKQLNSGDTANQILARNIVEQLKQIVDSSSPEILNLIAQFAAGLNTPQAEELLMQIADLRIQKYADWSVKYERLDIAILKLLDSKITMPSQSPIGTTTSPSNPAAARRFAQLYSYAIERFIQGRNLDNSQRQQLTSVLAEIEEKCITRLLDDPQQNGIRRALAAKDMNALEAERKRLLDEVLPAKLGFDYGTNSDGSPRTTPLPLPDQPSQS